MNAYKIFFIILDLVVDSASSIAASFGLSQTLIGLTVVAFGTSLPELVTSVVAKADHHKQGCRHPHGDGIVPPEPDRKRMDGSAGSQDHHQVDALMLLAFFLLFVGLTVRDALVNRGR